MVVEPKSLPRLNSGIDWLGELPSHWKVKRVGVLFTERRVKVSDRDFEPLSVTKSGVVPQLETAAKTDDGDNRKLVCEGDFVINSRSDRKGSSGLSTRSGSVSLINTVLKPEGLDGTFVHHLLRSVSFQEEFYRYGKGIVADLWSTNYSEMKAIMLPVPPIEEQRAIAEFLDRETAKIDKIIEKQERLIELLNEKRQAVISHAVSKGLDPSVPMKDSGIEWLGEVPIHWSYKALKRIWSVTDCKHLTAEFVDDGIPLASIREVQGWEIRLDNAKQTTEEFYNLLVEGNRMPSNGDIVFSRNATVGQTAKVTERHPRFAMGQDVCLLRKLKPCESTDFLLFVMRSRIVEAQLANMMIGSTFKRVNVEEIKSIVCPSPPPTEQSEIAEYLAVEMAKIDALIDKAQESSELMKERRAALISAAVTGKIDVAHPKKNRVEVGV